MPSLSARTVGAFGQLLLRHDDVDGASRTGREVLGEDVLPVAGLGVSQHQVARGDSVGLQLEHAGGRDQEHARC